MINMNNFAQVLDVRCTKKAKQLIRRKRYTISTSYILIWIGYSRGLSKVNTKASEKQVRVLSAWLSQLGKGATEAAGQRKKRSFGGGDFPPPQPLCASSSFEFMLTQTAFISAIAV